MPRPSRDNLPHLFTSHPPDAATAAKHDAINTAAIACAEAFMDNAPESPELTLAIRALEEARMWANAALATN
jgi:hypothetical protein